MLLASGTFDANTNPPFFTDDTSQGNVFTSLGTATDPLVQGSVVAATVSTQVRDNTSMTIPSCDFTNDIAYDVDDINLMFPQGNLVTGVSVSAGNKFDLNGDNAINQDDVTRWLPDAASNNQYATPHRREDTDDLGKISPAVRDVDITDFSSLATNFDPLGNRDFRRQLAGRQFRR